MNFPHGIPLGWSEWLATKEHHGFLNQGSSYAHSFTPCSLGPDAWLFLGELLLNLWERKVDLNGMSNSYHMCTLMFCHVQEGTQMQRVGFWVWEEGSNVGNFYRIWFFVPWESHIGSMGLVYLKATFCGGFFLWEFHVGKYTFRPIDPMVIEPPLWKARTIQRLDV